ncbi:MAG: hypothetical protein RLZZ505_1529 [Verrucomicrobiota bacterium]|jgi:hypothetical protein
MKSKPTETRTAMASTKADLRELRDNSRATVGEIQAFLRELKGKSPQEMLGVVSASGLFRSLVLSTVLVVGGILLFTAIPYFMGGEEKPAPVAEKPAPAEVPVETPKPVEPAEEPAPDPLSKLGVGEELSAPPNTNPLENKGDDFLKDLE